MRATTKLPMTLTTGNIPRPYTAGNPSPASTDHKAKRGRMVGRNKTLNRDYPATIDDTDSLMRLCTCDDCMAKVRDEARARVLARSSQPWSRRAGLGEADYMSCGCKERPRSALGQTQRLESPTWLTNECHSRQIQRPLPINRSFLVSNKAVRRKLGRAKCVSSSTDKRLRDLEKLFGLAEKHGVTLKSTKPGPLPSFQELQRRERRRRKRIQAAGEQRFAAVDIQRIWRGYSARKRTRLVHGRICLAQALIRGHIQRVSREIETLRAEREAATMIQSFMRKKIACAEVGALREARARAEHEAALIQQQLELDSATTLQSIWRGNVARNSFSRRRSSVIMVQSLFRQRFASREVEELRQERHRQSEAILMIQKCTRGALTRTALRAAKEDSAARVIQKLMRWYLNRAQLRLHRLLKNNLQNMWNDLRDEASSGEECIKLLLKDYPQFDRNEAAIHAALFIMFARRNFDEAVDLVQSHASTNDPRACYLRALAMRLGGRGAPGLLVQLVGKGKQLELDIRLREEKVTPKVFFGPGRTTALPCMEELEFLLRTSVNASGNLGDERAKRLCIHGAFRHLVVKDTDGAERLLLEAAALTPHDPFVSMCFYGRDAKPDEPLPSPGLCEEDFAGSGALCVLIKEDLILREFDHVRVSVLERRSKRGRIDLMFSATCLSSESNDKDDQRKTLIMTHSQLREWASFLDQPDAITVKCAPLAVSLYAELVDSLDVVRTDRDNATWSTVELALRFTQRSIGTRVQRTRMGHLLSITFFLEEQLRLRITAYCAALDDSFAVVLGKTQIESLCIDSPFLKRMFATRGWRRATHFSPLLDRVARLLELVDPPPETPRYLSYTRSDPLLVNNRVVKRPFKQQYNSLGLTSGKFLKISGLEEAMRSARRNWAAERIQSLFHLQRAYDAYYQAILDRAATHMQRIWRGYTARRAGEYYKAEARKHRAASKLAAFGHGIRDRKKLQNDLKEIMGTASSGSWQAYWCAAAVQRRFGGVLYDSIYSFDVDADVDFGALATCDGDFELARELYFERAVRVWPQSSRPLIVYALALMEFTHDYTRAMNLLAQANELRPVHPKFYQSIEMQQQSRAQAVLTLQRMWRHTRSRPRYSFFLASEMACAQKAIEMGLATVSDWEAHVFGLQALHFKDLEALDIYERTLLRRFPQRFSFRLGHAILRRQYPGPVPENADLEAILRYFRHAVRVANPKTLAPALANLSLLYWFLGAHALAEGMIRRAMEKSPDCSASLEAFYTFRKFSKNLKNCGLPTGFKLDDEGNGNMGLQSAIRAQLKRRLELERAAQQRVEDEILAQARECEEMRKHDKPPPSFVQQRTMREAIMTQSQIAEARRKAKQERRNKRKGKK